MGLRGRRAAVAAAALGRHAWRLAAFAAAVSAWWLTEPVLAKVVAAVGSGRGQARGWSA